MFGYLPTMMASLRLGLPTPPAPISDIVRVRKIGAIYPSRTLTNTPYTVNNQMVSQPPAPEFMDTFPILAQLAVTWRWRL